jgi:hypothetical protein
VIITQVKADLTISKMEITEKQEQDREVLREIRLINAGIICCQQYTEPVEGDRSGRLRHCPCCMANYKIREKDMELI